jgi:hypothetical protein
LQGIWGTFNAALGWWDDDSDDEAEAKAPKSNQDLARDSQRAKLKEKRAVEQRKMTRAAKAARMKEIEKEQERIQKLKDSIPARIEDEQAESLKWGEEILDKQQQISDLRTKISKLKGGGEEDDQFHIDASRDQHGNTFLMVAAQNNDIETARLCFHLKADPNVRSREGFTAMSFAFVFKLHEMVSLLVENGGTYPRQQMEVWKDVMSAGTKSENSVDWDTTLRIAEQAAIPPETILESAQVLEASEDSRMAVLTEEERQREFVFFDNSLVDGQISSNNMRRVVLLSKDAYRWFSESEACSKSVFIAFLDALKPEELRKQRSTQKIVGNRRAVVGMKKTYEVLCAPLQATSQVVLFTPFVSSAVEGVTDVGVLGMFWTPLNCSRYNRPLSSFL